VDAAGAVTQVFYDTKGNVISRVAYTTALSAAAMTQLAADPSSMPAPVAGSAASNYVYDDDNRLAFTIDPFGAVSESRYDANGNVIETVRYATPIQSRNGLTVSSVRSLLSVDSAKDIHQRNRYDSNGRLTWSIDALGGVTEHRYDANGNVSRTIVYASGLAGTLADSAVPQVVATVSGGGAYVLSNALDRVTDYVYDAKGRLISQTDGAGTSAPTTQSWAYDSAGNAIRHTDGRGNTSWSAYDAANRLVRHIDAAGYVTTRSYFADGRVKSETRYTNAVALPQGANDAWAYAAANPVANSDPLAGDQTTSWTYDSAGRVQTSTDAANVVTFYAYDGLGNLTDTTVAYGTAAASTVHRNYDRASRVSTETRAYGTIDAFTTQYGYDTWGNQTTITAGGLTTTQYFDVLGRKTGVKDASQALTTTTYNVFGDIVKVTDARNNSGYFFTDALGRVTDAGGPGRGGQ
jgi:YD repeat-containing protein